MLQRRARLDFEVVHLFNSLYDDLTNFWNRRQTCDVSWDFGESTYEISRIKEPIWRCGAQIVRNLQLLFFGQNLSTNGAFCVKIITKSNEFTHAQSTNLVVVIGMPHLSCYLFHKMVAFVSFYQECWFQSLIRLGFDESLNLKKNLVPTRGPPLRFAV